MMNGRIGRVVAAIGLACVPVGSVGCGPPRDPSIVYKKMTPEEFARLIRRGPLTKRRLP